MKNKQKISLDHKQLLVETLPLEYLRTYKKENIESTRICFKRRVKKSCDPESKKYLVRHLRLKRGRCHMCPRNLDRKTTAKCDKCEKYVCGIHANTSKLCDNCLD
ncbi:hypothetical protein KGM_208248 [Danaus plexippus plexippus]|uniref:PiggyBac transposable element-derived protein 4-like n=1 Tax=Danaus plexippus plexippus TaxID=278856 RepID=A0A212FGX8_DANPL|nr:hypothetical protein KGM_208248 [Danaus plexippus plexippus]